MNNEFLKLWMESNHFQDGLKSNVHGAAIVNVASVKILKQLQIPLPPFDTQKQIVAEIEREQEMVEECKKLITIHERKIKDKIAEVWGE